MSKRLDPALAQPPLFVYGTLRRGFAHPMARLLARQARYLGPARVAGRLYHLGSYPGMVLSHRPNEWVFGDLYDLSAAPGLRSRLDSYEGIASDRKGIGEYRRQTVSAFLLEDDSQLVASIYLYVRPVKELRRLFSGNYLREWRRPPER